MSTKLKPITVGGKKGFLDLSDPLHPKAIFYVTKYHTKYVTRPVTTYYVTHYQTRLRVVTRVVTALNVTYLLEGKPITVLRIPTRFVQGVETKVVGVKTWVEVKVVRPGHAAQPTGGGGSRVR